MSYKIIEYTRPDGSNPFREWLDALDKSTKARIQARLARIEYGHLGEYKILGQGINELKINFGSGYRVYFAIFNHQIVLLLGAGDKNSQRKDISKAKTRWFYFEKENLK